MLRFIKNKVHTMLHFYHLNTQINENQNTPSEIM